MRVGRLFITLSLPRGEGHNRGEIVLPPSSALQKIRVVRFATVCSNRVPASRRRRRRRGRGGGRFLSFPSFLFHECLAAPSPNFAIVINDNDSATSFRYSRGIIPRPPNAKRSPFERFLFKRLPFLTSLQLLFPYPLSGCCLRAESP